jgi:hypothetical protein
LTVETAANLHLVPRAGEPPDKAPRWVAYARSPDDAAIVALYAAAQGAEIVAAYEDGDADRPGHDRPGLIDAVREARRRDALVVSSFHQIGDEADLSFVLLGLGDAQLEQVLDEPYPDVLDVLCDLVGRYNDWRRSFRLAGARDAKRRQIREIGWSGGLVPYGFERDGRGGVQPFALEQHAIAVGLTMRAAGASLNTVGEYWGAAGVRLRAGTRFLPGTVKRVLDNATVNSVPLDALAKLFLDLPVNVDDA